MRRFSILTMMGGLGLIAFCMAAMRIADEFWQSIAVTLTLCALAIATLGVLQLRGGDRAGCVGFAAFGWGYLLVTLMPDFSDRIEPMTLTGYLLRSIRGAAQIEQGSPYRLILEAPERIRSLKSWLEGRKADTGGVDDPVMLNCIAEIKMLEAKLAGPAPEEQSAVSAVRVRAMLPGVLRGEEFTRIGHCLSSLVFAFLGAVVSRKMWMRRMRQNQSFGASSPVDG